MLGFWVLLDYTPLLFSAMLLLLWFNFVVAPFEEKEHTVLFGDQYVMYSMGVPRMIPLTKRCKK